MKLRCDWQSVVGVIRLYRETENGEWRIFDNDWCGSRSAFNEEELRKGAPSNSPFSILHIRISFLMRDL
jgi:hypothetical protein